MTNPEYIDSFDQLARGLQVAMQKFNRIFFLADENTSEFCLQPLLACSVAWPSYHLIETEAGETCKNIDVYGHIIQTLIEEKADKSSLLINVGGGSITDLGGFVGSTYMRGMPFIHIPTSLLAMTDAAIGGKTGIDFVDLKNMIGTIAHPERIFITREFLKSLPDREMKCGLAEMFKHGLVANASLWNDLKKSIHQSGNTFSSFLESSIEVKMNIVKSDEKEKNVRKLLNFGHTFGHAIETSAAMKKLDVVHGEAVMAGMVIEAQLSFLTGRLSEQELLEIKTELLPLVSKSSVIFSFDSLWESMLHDKKKNGDSINFTLLAELGKGEINCNCPREICAQAYSDIAVLTI